MTTYEHRTRPPVVHSDIWEAFGCPPDATDPTARLIHYHAECDCLDPLTGVSYIRFEAPGIAVHASGDDTSGVFLKVYGANETVVRAMYARAAAVLPEILHRIWNTPLEGRAA